MNGGLSVPFHPSEDRGTGRRWPVLAPLIVGGGLLFAAAPSPRDARGEALSAAAREAVYPAGRADVEAAARRDPLAFLRTALRWHEQKIADYTCTFVKREAIGGKVGNPETMAMKFREQPFAVYLKWTGGPDKGQEVIYAQGRYKDQLVVHPPGLRGFFTRKVFVDPTGDLAMKRSRRPITFVGMANQLRVIIPECEDALRRGDLAMEYAGVRDVAGRPAYVLKRTMPDGKGYPCYLLLLYLDAQFLVATRTEAYDWQERLLSDYQYTDLAINPGLTEHDFDPDNRAYGYRR
jgi:hypothetical protein